MRVGRQVFVVAAGSLAAFVACSVGGAELPEDGVGLPERDLTASEAREAREAGPDACGARRCIDDRTLDECGVSFVCTHGCLAAESRCYQLEPAGAAEPEDYLSATGDLVLAGGAFVADTVSGSIRGPGGELRPAGGGVLAGVLFRSAAQAADEQLGRPSPELAIFGARRIAIAADATLSFTGTRAIALVAGGSVDIDGTVSVAGDCAANAPGPAGYAHDDGLRPGIGGGNTVCGGRPPVIQRCIGGAGGGGGGTAGGRGGTANSANGGAAGGALGLDGGPFVLFGGSGGGSTGAQSTGVGGAGGGALQIAANDRIRIGGIVTAAGCGGALGSGNNNGGGGGGAGGMIVLESASIEIGGAGVVAANGGGGASGASNTAGGAPGGTGTSGATPAAGGIAAGCPGGTGGATDAAAGQGTNCAPTGLHRSAAGGGGASGRITLNGVASLAIGAVASPEPTTGSPAKR